MRQACQYSLQHTGSKPHSLHTHNNQLYVGLVVFVVVFDEFRHGRSCRSGCCGDSSVVDSCRSHWRYCSFSSSASWTCKYSRWAFCLESNTNDTVCSGLVYWMCGDESSGMIHGSNPVAGRMERDRKSDRMPLCFMPCPGTALHVPCTGMVGTIGSLGKGDARLPLRGRAPRPTHTHVLVYSTVCRMYDSHIYSIPCIYSL